MSDPTDKSELEPAHEQHQALERSFWPWARKEPSVYPAASCSMLPEDAIGTLIKASPVGSNISTLSAAPLTQGSPHCNSTLLGHTPTSPSRATIAVVQAPCPADPQPPVQMEDSTTGSAAQGIEVDTDYIALLLGALHSINSQPPVTAGQTASSAAALPTFQSLATLSSHLQTAQLAHTYMSTNMQPAVAMDLQGSSLVQQSEDTMLQQLQLARLLLNKSSFNTGSSSSPDPEFPTLATLSALLSQQLLLSTNALVGAGTGALQGQMQPAFAAGTLGPHIDLGVVHAAAAAAATAAVAKQCAAMDASMQSGHRSLSPTRHAFRSDGSINTLYKTQCCRAWMNSGYCKYEERCQFAHGSADIHGVYRPAKYKTVPCRNIRAAGRCPFGKRCNFVHEGEDDLSSSATSSTGGASPTSTAGSDGSRRSSSSTGLLPGHSANKFGGFAGNIGVPNMLASGLLHHQMLTSGLQCNQLVMPGGLGGIGPGTLDIGGLKLLNLPPEMVPPGSGNISGLLQYENPALALNELLLGSQGGLSSAIRGVPGQVNAGMGQCPGNYLEDILRTLQLR